MSVTCFVPFRRFSGRSTPAPASGMTLVEIMVSLAILVLTTVGGVSGFVMLNQYASSLRNISSAKALCQERVEEVQTMTFNPPLTVPTVPGQTDGQTYYPLGQLTNYDATGKLTASGTLTTASAEPVQVYLQQDGTANTVPGTRTTSVALSSLTDSSTGNTGASLKVVMFTATVTYTYRGKSYSYSMYTLRAPD